ncbi:hypothetical protein PoB_003613400 [Plakobranchus ocellatus]|uniref:Uncharacterized protein n=1 Tax=Plakobranchus ocellatus TaxID=259542 RepID=A0AAV4AU42_9GAST|nr:hypothetical protein PoB_003613400 [Plakobranchus ocellatus]
MDWRREYGVENSCTQGSETSLYMDIALFLLKAYKNFALTKSQGCWSRNQESAAGYGLEPAIKSSPWKFHSRFINGFAEKEMIG